MGLGFFLKGGNGEGVTLTTESFESFVSAPKSRRRGSPILCKHLCKSCRPVLQVVDGGENKTATHRLDSSQADRPCL